MDTRFLTQRSNFKMAMTLSLAAALALSTPAGAQDSIPATNKVTYRLPYDGKEQTYRVTLAAAPKGDPNWLVGTFQAGAVRTVNEKNKGVFTDEWNGLDDNFMPVPPGEYTFKGIYMPAQKWKIDGQFHSLTAKFLASPGDSWTPPREQDHRFPPIHGHVFEPIYQVSVADGGKAIFYSGYIENWRNPFLVDLNRDVGIDQVVFSFDSSGFAGGQLCAFDGTHTWVSRGGMITSPSQKFFGTEKDNRGRIVTWLSKKPGEAPNDLAVVKVGKKPYLYVSEPYAAQIAVLDGNTGKTVKEIGNLKAAGIAMARAEKGSRLFATHEIDKGKWDVQAIDLKDGLPDGEWKTLFTLDASQTSAGDLDQDQQGNFFIVDPAQRQICKYSPDGKLLARIGKNQKLEGAYDPNIFVGLHKLACWTDKAGQDRLLVTETAGPMRISEWSCADGKLLRQWFLCQNAAGGFCLDPERPEHIYVTSLNTPGIIRFHVDYDTGKWHVDAYWEVSFPGGRLFPRIINLKGHKYLAFGGGSFRSAGSWMIFRLENDKWKLSATAIKGRWWHDANGDGEIQDNEFTSDNKGPGGTYWADSFLDDLSVMHVRQNGNDVLRLQPRDFDKHGNPIYDGKAWKQIWIDDWTGFVKRDKLKPLYGGNELGRSLWNWSDIAGDPDKALYLAGVYKPDARKDYRFDEAGQICAQWKLTCLVPDGKGGYQRAWRVGRKAFGAAQPGEVYATMHISPPHHGMLGVMDGNGIYHVFTTEGLYVDTLMYDRFRFGRLEPGGIYSHSGGAYFGRHFLNTKNDKVYLLMGRASNNIYEVENWRPGFVQPLTIETKVIDLPADKISPAHPFALQLRGIKG
jgi:hypothetical protein